MIKTMTLAGLLAVAVFVTIDWTSAETTELPSITIGPRDQKVVETGVASFFCQASGRPPPEIQWRLLGRRVSVNRARFLIVNSTKGSVLRIDPVRSRDEGQVECRVETADGEATSANATLEVYTGPNGQDGVSGYPRIVESPVLQAAEKGTNVTMPCVAVGTPHPTITWLKDFFPIFGSEGRITVNSTGFLHIEDVDETHEGKYECVAENEVGTAFSYFANLYVRVRRVAPHFSIPPEHQDVMPGGNASLSCVAVGSPMPYVKWKLGSRDLTPDANIPIGRNVLVLTDIRQSATYTCIAYSELGTVSFQAEVRVKALPKPPINLSSSNITPTSVRLKWTTGNGEDPPVESHVIRYRRRQGPSRDTGYEEAEHFGRHLEHVISALVPYTTYEFQVVAVNNIGRSAPSNIVVISTLESKPGSPPQNVRARPVSSSTVVVQWDEPNAPNGIIKGYKVYFTLKPEDPVSSWSMQAVDNSQLTTVSNLVTNRTYHVVVLGFTGVGDGPLSEPVQVKTQQGVPGQPISVRGKSLTPRSIKVTWDAPDPPGESLESYELYYNDSSFKQNVHVTISPPRTTFTMEDLTPHTNYLIKVAARSSRGEGAPSPTISVTTMEDVPSSAPQMVQAEAVDSTSFKVTWSPIPKDQQNGVVVGYRILYADVAGNQAVDGPLVVKETAPGTERSHVVKRLNKWTQYNVWVRASTTQGDGPPSDVIVVQTAEDVPGEPRNVRVEAINSTGVVVQWRPPSEKDQHGIIRGFQIIYSKMSADNIPVGQASVYDIMDGSAKETMITGLESDTEYQFQVAAYTRKGDGERSRPKKIKTKGAVLGAPRNVQLSLVQEDPPVVSVTWQAPRSPLSVILGYRVLFGIVGSTAEEMEERRFDGDKYKFTTGFLDRGVEYEFRVSSRNAIDYGDPAIERIQTPEGIPAGSPLNATHNLVTSTSVQLVWEPPAAKHRNGEIVLYEIIYHERLNYVDDWMTNTTDTWIMIEGLEPDSSYLFQIRAYTKQGCGPWSGPVEVATAKQEGDAFVPSPPSNIQLKRLSPSTIRVTWDPHPSTVPGVAGYQIYYNLLAAADLDKWNSFDVEGFASSGAEISGLQQNTAYAFMVRTRMDDGRFGQFSRIVLDRGSVNAVSEDMVQNLNARKPTASSVLLDWSPPRKPGLLYYKVDYRGMKSNLDEDEVERVVDAAVQRTVAKDQRSVTFENLVPSTVYTFNITAKFLDGLWGPATSVSVDTTPDDTAVPEDMVQNFVAPKPGTSSVVLRWSPPRKPGMFYYRVDYRGMKSYRDENLVERVVDSDGQKIVSKDQRSVTFENLVPSTVYTFNITANFIDGHLGTATNINVETTPDDPPPIPAPRVRGKSGSGFAVRLFAASEVNGKILRYFLIVVQSDVSDKRPGRSFNMNELTRQGPDDDQKAWVAASFSSSPPIEFIVGGDGSQRSTAAPAVSVMMLKVAGKYQNRPLTKGKAYRVFLRACTSETKCTSSPYSDKLDTTSGRPGEDGLSMESHGSTTEDPESIDILWIVAPVCVAVVIVLLCVLGIVFVRRSCRREEPLKPRKVLLSPGETPHYPHDPVELRRLNFQTPAMARHPPILVAHLPDAINRLKSNDREGFSQEYESIEPGQQFTWEASSADVNKMKNRYANVIAYDHSRVALRTMDGLPGSDYINANFMDGYCRQNAYVATQGPLVETFADFWRMVWEQRCTTIVMMTKLEERNRIKCDQYWPIRGTEMYGLVQVTAVDVMEMATFTIRTFQISQVNSLERRDVHQLQFTAWPDHGVPDHPTPLLNFIRKVKAVTPPEAGPMVVHCSAGVGRSGTFIVIDAMLERIQHEKTIDIYGHVTCLRAQRNYMVQTEDQYVFIYDSVLEAVESGNTEVPADSLYVHVQHLTHLEPGETITGMELEFKKLNNMKMNPMQFASANLPINKYKNRLVNILPYESTRVCLQPIRGVEGSDYINANFVDGYRFRKTYIATQGPLAETIEDFWRMLWEHNCSIVVMLTKLKELGREKCTQYWPDERSARYQYFVVDPVAQYNMPLYILREFKVTDARDGQSRIVRQFQFTDWPEQGVPSSGEGFIEFIGHVQKTKEQFGQDGPITVHCSMGVGRTGVFIVLSIVLERMRYEGVVDLFQTVKMLRNQRPAMVQSEEQYSFCYRAALEYLSSFDHYTN